MTSLEKGLRDFAEFAAKLNGDEKSETRTFLFHLLAAFGHDANTLPEGSTFKYRVRFPGPPRPEDGSGVKGEGQRTRFADFVWPGRCLIEMKSRGVKLSKHYQQTFDYWLNLVPHRLRHGAKRRHADLPVATESGACERGSKRDTTYAAGSARVGG